MSRIRSRILIVAALLGIAAVPVRAQAPIWRNDWTTQQAPSLGPYYSSVPYLSYQQQEPFAFSSDGELLMRTPSPSQEDDEITRFTAAGAVRWHVNLGSLGASSQPSYDPMLGYADGSAVVATQQGNAVVRINADGTLAWSQTLVVDSIAPLGPQTVAALGCNKVTALDVQSGQTLWTRALTPQSGNCHSSLISDSAGNGYAALFSNTSNGEIVQLFKFSPTGQILWQRSDPSNYAAQFLGSGATVVYLASPTGMQAFSAANGTLAWSADGARGLCGAGTPAEPIVVVNGDAQRLAEADGQPRWHHTVAGGALFASCSDTRVLVQGDALDAASGALLWQAALPSADQDGASIAYLNSGIMSDGSAMFGGYAYGTSGRPFLVRADAATGQLIGAPLILPRTQSPISASVRVDANTIVRAAATVAPSGGDLRVRAVDADTGATRWNVLESLDFYPGSSQSTSIAAGGSVVAVTVAGDGGGWVGAFDRTYGYMQWEKLLYVNFNSGYQPFAIFGPLVDASGNVFVSYATRVFCPYPLGGTYTMCKQLSVVKLGPDGSIIWQHDDVFGYFSGQIFAGVITLAGDDVMVVSDFTAPYGADGLLKLSGADGSVLWGSPIYRQNGNQITGVFVEPDDGNLIVTGPGWTKLDSASGNTLWFNPPENGCAQYCYAYNPVIFDDGSLLSAAEDQNGRMWVTLLPAAAGAMAQTWHPDQTDTRVTSSFATLPFRDSSGNIWMYTIKRYGKSADDVFYLSRFDLQSGTFSSQQALTLYGRDPLLQWLAPVPLAAPEDGRLLVAFDGNQAPAPYVSGDAMLDSTIVATGNLGVQVFTDHSFAAPGDVLNFHVVASYNGTLPITGARLLFASSWPGHATVLSCITQAASNCVIDTRGSAMTATFDVQSGGYIDIIGQLRVAASANPQLRALVAGPIGLNELDTSDNGVSVLIDQTIFANGFE